MFDQKGAGLHAYGEDDGGDGEGGGGGAGPSDVGASKAPSSFTLDYYDEYGRKMSQKQARMLPYRLAYTRAVQGHILMCMHADVSQAFRQLSWKFHGKVPSKKNREKRMLEVRPYEY